MNPNPLFDIVNVKPLDNFVLLLTFNNGEEKIFNMQKYLHIAPFNRINNTHIFKQVSIKNGTIWWPGDIDFNPLTLYNLGITPPK